MASKKDLLTEAIDTTASVLGDIKLATGNTTEAEAPAKKPARKASTKTTKTSKAATSSKRKTYTKKETEEAKENLQTKGKKGMALQRMNLAFTPSNYEYIKTMAAMQGISHTEFINSIIKADAEANAAAYKKILKIRDSIK